MYHCGQSLPWWTVVFFVADNVEVVLVGRAASTFNIYGLWTSLARFDVSNELNSKGTPFFDYANSSGARAGPRKSSPGYTVATAE
jgi:hypothetical protein